MILRNNPRATTYRNVPRTPVPAAGALSRTRAWVVALAISVPRFALAYPLYTLSPLLTVDFRHSSARSYRRLAVLVGLGAIGYLISSTQGQVSQTAFLVEMILMSPLLLFATGFAIRGNGTEALRAIRVVNGLTLVLSVASLFAHGFPGKIPYLTLTPDDFSGLYGLGGARNVTILGFLGLFGELCHSRAGAKAAPGFILVAVVNFLAPSYIIGIVCGLLAFSVFYARRPRYAFALAAVSLPSLWYAFFVRLRQANDVFAVTTGYNPKALAFILIGRVFRAFPRLIFFGVGPGQFSSTPQTWEDPGLRAVSVHAVPHLPGLAASGFEQQFLQPFTQIGLVYRYALSSSIDKPYNGVETLVVEWGLVGIGIMVLVLIECVRLSRVNSMIWIPVLFIGFINIADMWIDSLWLGLALLLAKGVATSPVPVRRAALRREPAAGFP